jgi:hypothetical protein
MVYKVFGYIHAAVHWRVREIQRLAGERGQGTVEYVGLILLVSLLMVGMVAAMKGFNRSFSKTRYYLRSRKFSQADGQFRSGPFASINFEPRIWVV